MRLIKSLRIIPVLLCIALPVLNAHAQSGQALSDTATVRKIVEEMASNLPHVNNVKEALIDEYLPRIPFEQVGVFEKRSLKIYKGDKDFLDNVIGNGLIKKAENGQVMPNNVFSIDTLLNIYEVTNWTYKSTECFIILYYCKKSELKNGHPIYIFATHVLSDERYAGEDEEQVRNILKQENAKLNAILEPYNKLRKWADDLKRRNIPFYAIIVYKAYKKKYYANVNNLCQHNLDTIGFCKDSIQALSEHLKQKYSADFVKLDSINVQLEGDKEKRAELLKTTLVLSGKIQNKDGSRMFIWGKASPFNSVNPEGSLMGMIAANYVSSLVQAVNQLKGGSDGVEDIPGAIVNDDANLIIDGYSPEHKYMGSASIGGQIVAGPYVYKGQSVGTNEYGASVPVFHYIPNPKANKIASLKDEINHLVKLQQETLTKIDSQEAALLSKEELDRIKMQIDYLGQE